MLNKNSEQRRPNQEQSYASYDAPQENHMNLCDKSRSSKHALILTPDAINEHTAESHQHAKNKNPGKSVASKRNQDADGPDGLQNVKTKTRFS